MFTCGVPRNSDELARVLNLERSLFGDLSVPEDMAHKIFEICPEVYTVIRAPDDTVAAYSSALALKPEWAAAFIAGNVTEPDLTPDMMLGRHDSLEGSHIYIGSVVVASHYDSLTKVTLLASLLSWRVQQLRAASVKRLSVIMTPVTEQGERMVRYAGALKLNDGVNRKDGHAVYGREITPGFLCHTVAAIERCLNGCAIQMNLNFRPGLDQSQTIPSDDEAPGHAAHSPWATAVLDKLVGGKAAALWAIDGMRDSVSSISNRGSVPLNLNSYAGHSAALSLIVLATAALLAADIFLAMEHLIFAYLLPIFLISIRHGKVPAHVALTASAFSGAFFFYPPKFSVYIDEPKHMVELACFCAIAFLMGQFFDRRPSRLAFIKADPGC